MLVNKLRDSTDFKTLKDIPAEYFDNLEKNTPEYLLKLIGKIIAVFLYRLNVPREEVENFTDQIERRKFAMLFDSFEAYDVQETRRVSREEGRKAGREEGREDGIRAFLELCREFHMTRQETLQQLTEKFSLTETEAEKYMRL
jgi:flagellar biosynthesis/type III secretory pathway protein FliH